MKDKISLQIQFKQNSQNLMQSKLSKHIKRKVIINLEYIKILLKIELLNYLKNKKNNNMIKTNIKLNKTMTKNYLVIKDVAIHVIAGLE